MLKLCSIEIYFVWWFIDDLIDMVISRDNSAEGTVRNGTFYIDESFVPN